MKDKAIDNALRLASQKKVPTYERPTSNSVDAHKDAVSLLNDLDAEFPHLADGYKKGGKVSPKVGSDAYWAERDAIYAKPFSERMNSPTDPMWHISPEEYRKGNLGRKEYALSTGGRAGYATGGNPELDTSNPIVDQSTQPQDSTVNYVNSLYQNIMGRAPDKEGAQYWANQLESGNVSQADVLQQFAGSKEFQGLYKDNPTQAINTLYQTALGRAPEKEGLDYWTNQAKGGMNLADLVGGFVNSQEGQDVQDINQIYQDFTGQMPSMDQLQKAKQAYSTSSDYDEFLQKAFPEEMSGWGTQVASADSNTPQVSVLDTVKDAASSVIKNISPELNSSLAGLLGRESGGTKDPFAAAAKTSSAKGLFQFIDSTWLSQFAKMFGEQIGLTPKEIQQWQGPFNRKHATPLQKEVLALRTDKSPAGVNLNMAMGIGFNQDNINKLAKVGLPPTPENIYSVHLTGGTRLAEAYAANPNSPISKGMDARQLASNRHYQGRSVGSVMGEFQKMFKPGSDQTTLGQNILNKFGDITGNVQFASGQSKPEVTASDPSQAWIQQINSIYDKYLHQAPSDQGLKNLLGQLSSGKVTMADIDNFIKNSDAAKTATAYQTYRQQYDKWKAASDARRNFEAEYVANEVRNGRNPFSPPANVGPQVPPMPQWDNNKLPEMTKQYTYPEYTPQELQQQYTPQQIQQFQTTQAGQDYFSKLAQQGAPTGVGTTGMVNPTGAPIGAPVTTVGSVTQSGLPGQWTPQGMTDTSQANKAFTDAMAGANAAYSSHIDPITGQFTPITWDPTTGVGIHSPSYLGPNQYVGKIEGYGNYGPVYNSIGSYNPSSVTGYTSPTATNFTGTLAYGPGFKKGGVVKPTEEDVEKALRIAKRKGGRVNTKIDKDPVFDMSLKDGGGAWTRKEGQNPEGGLNAKGRASAKAEGHNLKPPAPHPKTDKDAARRKSFCSRMKGMKAKLTSSETANDPDSRINKSLRAWNCHSDGGAVDRALKIAEGGKVWDKKRPKDLGEPKALSKGQKKSAKAAAKAAGRPYPNLVDNMRAAQRKK